MVRIPLSDTDASVHDDYGYPCVSMPCSFELDPSEIRDLIDAHLDADEAQVWASSGAYFDIGRGVIVSHATDHEYSVDELEEIHRLAVEAVRDNPEL